MSIVIVGGNERMVRQYKDLCKQYNCKTKVFPKKISGLKTQMGNPDLLVLFTSTMSHKLVKCAISNTSEDTTIVRSHSSSMSSLKNILNEHIQ